MIQQLTVQELQQRLADGERPFVLDVREAWEYQVCALPDSVHIPMQTLPARLQELPRDGAIVVVCHHGNRSQVAAGFLERHGFAPLYNLRGGVDAWAKQIDPSMATY